MTSQHNGDSEQVMPKDGIHHRVLERSIPTVFNEQTTFCELSYEKRKSHFRRQFCVSVCLGFHLGLVST